MLETPLQGRILGEGRRVIFGPSEIYRRFVQLTIAVGAGMAAFGLWLGVSQGEGFGPRWWLSTGLMVLAAGGWASLAMVRIIFDIKEGTYRRWQGDGIVPRYTVGKLRDIDALVVTAQPMLAAPGATYRLTLHWKGGTQPPMVVLQDSRHLNPGSPINAAVGPMMQQAQMFSRALSLPLYDNSHLVRGPFA